ncbi:ABC transporter permease [Agromyces silvae]|uniref:ABC transporter permease n=1 Tax=Agromyces silvae TaxID=3388266 RepID=UPI00280ABBF8|nr:ABC transporter permease [Agromyces protaetiae]
MTSTTAPPAGAKGAEAAEAAEAIELDTAFDGADRTRSAGSRLFGWFQRQRWWITRVAVLPVHLLLFAIFTFILIRLMPGDPVIALLGNQSWTQEDYDRLQAALGLDGSIFDQLATYLSQLVTLDLGQSFITKRDISTELALRLPGTIELAFLSLIIAAIISGIGSFMAISRPKGVIARLAHGYARAAGAVPDFVLAIGGILLFYSLLRWIPAPIGRLDAGLAPPTQITGFPLIDAIAQGYWAGAGSMLAHLALPVIALALAQVPILIRLTIAGLEKAIEAPATLFRVASGAPRFTVLLSVYRRALPPVVTVAGSIFGGMIGGAVVIENLFGFTGAGRYAAEAVATGDYLALQGFLLATAALMLVIFLVIDMTNMILDPRRRPGTRI